MPGSAATGLSQLEAIRAAARLRLPRSGWTGSRSWSAADTVCRTILRNCRIGWALNPVRSRSERVSRTASPIRRLSPDGLPNYGLRWPRSTSPGVNTPDSIINTNDTRLLARGFNVGLLDPHHTDGRVQDWNVTFEKEIVDNMVMRVGYIGNYGDKQQQEVHYNDSTPD